MDSITSVKSLRAETILAVKRELEGILIDPELSLIYLKGLKLQGVDKPNSQYHDQWEAVSETILKFIQSIVIREENEKQFFRVNGRIYEGVTKKDINWMIEDYNHLIASREYPLRTKEDFPKEYPRRGRWRN